MSLQLKEIQIVVLSAEGKSTKEIAKQLELSLWTVQTDRQRIYEKLEINSVALLTQWALAKSLVKNRFLETA